MVEETIQLNQRVIKLASFVLPIHFQTTERDKEMAISFARKATSLVFAAVAGAICFAPVAQATPIHYNFTVDVTSGPLSGTSENGSFSYDSSSVVPGGINLATGLLTALDFNFNGITYNAGTANTGWLNFNPAGALIGFAFGPDCSAGSCGVDANTNDWWVTPGSGGFLYATPTTRSDSGNVTFALASVPVPEPGTLGLFGFGLLLLGVSAWRRSPVLRAG